MPLADLTEEEKAVVFDCLKCVASGKVILHDWEFPTLFGIEVADLLAVVEQWPDVDDSQVTVSLAINNSMNHLLGYPHGQHARWAEFMPVSQAEVSRVFQKWRGESVSGYFDGIQ